MSGVKRDAGVGGRSWEDARVLGEVHAKTPYLYHVPNWNYGENSKRGEMGRGLWGVRGLGWGWVDAGAMGEGPHKKTMSLSSPKAEKFEKWKNLGQKPVPKNGQFLKMEWESEKCLILQEIYVILMILMHKNLQK